MLELISVDDDATFTINKIAENSPRIYWNFPMLTHCSEQWVFLSIRRINE